jgi:hypothetical protein
LALAANNSVKADHSDPIVSIIRTAVELHDFVFADLCGYELYTHLHHRNRGTSLPYE